MGQSFGWTRDGHDYQDLLYSAPLAVLKALPANVDLRSQLPPVFDQGRIGSCSANAIAAAVSFQKRNAGAMADFMPARLFIYYNQRAIERTTEVDTGGQIRNGLKSISQMGVCPESMWPYDDTPADEVTRQFPGYAPAGIEPPEECYKVAINHASISYLRITRSLSQMRACLAEGHPFIFGFEVYQSMYDAGRPRRVVPLPSEGERRRGSHVAMVVGYNDVRQRFLVRNSWGPDVHNRGHFLLPYSYLLDKNLSDDFWTVRGM